MKNKIEELINDLVEGIGRREKRIEYEQLYPAELVALRNQNNAVEPVIKKLKKILEENK